ncbi:IS110 family transposase [bacterium]|nr:IS110 family transposase [bacterium]
MSKYTVAQNIAKHNQLKRKIKKLKRSNEVKLLDGERVHVAIDVHTRNYHVAMWSKDREMLVAYWHQPSSPEALCRSLLKYKDHIFHVVYEASYFGYTLVRTLRDHGFSADVIAPSLILTPQTKQEKSDRIDCTTLSFMDSKGLLRMVQVPTKQEEADRQVSRLREQTMRKQRRVKQHIKSFLTYHGIPHTTGLKFWANYAIQALRELKLDDDLRFCLDSLLDELDLLRRQITRINKRLQALMETERHGSIGKLLNTIPGVGLVTISTFRTEILAIERFRNEREVSKMCGLIPLVRRSEDKSKKGKLMKVGNQRVRTALIEAAWRLVHQDKKMEERFLKLFYTTANRNKAIVGIARRLAIIMWHMSIRREPYRVEQK